LLDKEEAFVWEWKPVDTHAGSSACWRN